MDKTIYLLGLIAGLLTTSAQLPQIIKSFKTKSTGDLSLIMYVFMFIGITLWLIYGIVLRDPPLILANLFSGIFAGCLLIMKLKYK